MSDGSIIVILLYYNILLKKKSGGMDVMESKDDCVNGIIQQYNSTTDIPCQILLHGIQRRQHEHRHHRFSPFSWTLVPVVGPFCMYGSCIARSATGLNDMIRLLTVVMLLSGAIQCHQKYEVMRF